MGRVERPRRDTASTNIKRAEMGLSLHGKVPEGLRSCAPELAVGEVAVFGTFDDEASSQIRGITHRNIVISYIGPIYGV